MFLGAVETHQFPSASHGNGTNLHPSPSNRSRFMFTIIMNDCPFVQRLGQGVGARFLLIIERQCQRLVSFGLDDKPPTSIHITLHLPAIRELPLQRQRSAIGIGHLIGHPIVQAFHHLPAFGIELDVESVLHRPSTTSGSFHYLLVGIVSRRSRFLKDGKHPTVQSFVIAEIVLCHLGVVEPQILL